MAKKQYEDWQLLHWLKEFAEELGKTPTQNEIENEPSMPSYNTYQNYFGGYNNAVIKAGLEINYRKYSKEELLKILKEFADKLGRAPKLKDFKGNDDIPCKVTFARRFGSYQKACEKIGYKPETKYSRHNYSKERLIKDLRNFALELGRTPTTREINENDDLVSIGSYVYYFDNYSSACRKAGLGPWEKGMKFDHLSEEEFQERVIDVEKEKVS